MESLHLITLLPYTVGLSALVWLLFILYRAASSPLRHVPGPFLARFSDAWYSWRISIGEFEKENIALHRKYGSIVRYGPNRYSFDHLDAAQTIYSVGAGNRFNKSKWYLPWGPPLAENLFTNQDNKSHAKIRRLHQSTYSLTSLVSYEAFVDECVDLFEQRLQEMGSDQSTGKEGIAVDMGHWLQCYAFDVIAMITYSKRLGFLDAGVDIGGVISGIQGLIRYASRAGLFPLLNQCFQCLRALLSSKKFTYIEQFTQECINQHQAEPKALSLEDEESGATMDFLSKFLARARRSPETCSQWYVLMGCAQNMAAGSDTTGISLSATLYHLLKNPRAMEKLREEVDEHKRTSPSKRITFKDTQNMPYLQAVIKETLRVHPATGLPLERVVPEGGATICNQFFPAGTIVGVNTWVEHNNERIFGPDAGEFRPERWLIDDAEKLAFMNRHWMPFGLGARTCIGRHVSYLEMSKLIPRMVRDFEFELPQSVKSRKASWKTVNLWFVKPEGFQVNVKVRSEQGEKI